jgi:alkylhydroperoxidase family enzyme
MPPPTTAMCSCAFRNVNASLTPRRRGRLAIRSARYCARRAAFSTRRVSPLVIGPNDDTASTVPRSPSSSDELIDEPACRRARRRDAVRRRLLSFRRRVASVGDSRRCATAAAHMAQCERCAQRAGAVAQRRCRRRRAQRQHDADKRCHWPRIAPLFSPRRRRARRCSNAFARLQSESRLEMRSRHQVFSAFAQRFRRARRGRPLWRAF